jgi:hypothetical protein
MITIRNYGGESASADLVCDAEFQLSTNRITLPIVGESHVEVRLNPGVNPPIEGTVQVKSGNFTQRVAIAAREVALASTSPKKAPTSRPSSKSSSRKSTPSAGSYVGQWSPYETDPTAPIDPVNIIRTVAMDGNSCTLEWHVERSDSTKFIAESRELKIENGQLAKIWHRHNGFKVERRGNHFRGTIENLQPSRMYTFRVCGLDGEGEPNVVVLEATLTTRPPVPKSLRPGWKSTFVILVVIIGGVAWWRRLRAPGKQAFDPTKTQKFV